MRLTPSICAGRAGVYDLLLAADSNCGGISCSVRICGIQFQNQQLPLHLVRHCTPCQLVLLFLNKQVTVAPRLIGHLLAYLQAHQTAQIHCQHIL